MITSEQREGPGCTVTVCVCMCVSRDVYITIGVLGTQSSTSLVAMFHLYIRENMKKVDVFHKRFR